MNTQANFEYNAFISYSRKDQEWANKLYEELTRLLNLSETVPATFSTFALFSKVLEVTCIGGKSWMKVV